MRRPVPVLLPEAARRGGEVDGPGAGLDEVAVGAAKLSQPGSEAVCVIDDGTLRFAVLAPWGERTEPKLEKGSTGLRVLLVVRFRDASRSRSRSSMISLRVRLRALEDARVWLIASEDLTEPLGGTTGSVGSRRGGRAICLPFSVLLRRKTVGLTFSLSSTTTSSSSGTGSVVGGVDGVAELGAGESSVQEGELPRAEGVVAERKGDGASGGRRSN